MSKTGGGRGTNQYGVKGVSQAKKQTADVLSRLAVGDEVDGYELLHALPDPDEVGTSEYGMLYEHLRDVVASAEYSGDEPKDLLLATLAELEDEIVRIRSLIDVANIRHDATQIGDSGRSETSEPNSDHALRLRAALDYVAANGFGDNVDADSIIEEAAEAHLAQSARSSTPTI